MLARMKTFEWRLCGKGDVDLGTVKSGDTRAKTQNRRPERVVSLVASSADHAGLNCVKRINLLLRRGRLM